MWWAHSHSSMLSNQESNLESFIPDPSSLAIVELSPHSSDIYLFVSERFSCREGYITWVGIIYLTSPSDKYIILYFILCYYISFIIFHYLLCLTYRTNWTSGRMSWQAEHKSLVSCNAFCPTSVPPRRGNDITMCALTISKAKRSYKDERQNGARGYDKITNPTYCYQDVVSKPVVIEEVTAGEPER